MFITTSKLQPPKASNLEQLRPLKYTLQQTPQNKPLGSHFLKMILFYCSNIQKMEEEPESQLINTAKLIKNRTVDLFKYLFEMAKPHVEHGLVKAEPIIDKSKEFYQHHKEVILIGGAAFVTWYFLRSRPKEEEKIKKKKQAQKVPQAASKTFISDNSDGFKEEPSTTNKVQSSGREIMKKKGNQKKLLERIDSSESNESGDQIFFAMYQNYQSA